MGKWEDGNETCCTVFSSYFHELSTQGQERGEITALRILPIKMCFELFQGLLKYWIHHHLFVKATLT